MSDAQRTAQGGRSEEAAYALLEQARMHAQEIADHAAGPQAERLHRVWSELGMAAYHVSAHIPAARRHELLAQAHGRYATQSGDLTRVGAAVTVLIADADGAISEAITVPELSDHVLLAAAHLVRVQELLGRRLADRDHRSPTPSG